MMCCHPQRYNFRTFQLRWTKELSQNFSWMCLGKWWAWQGGHLPFQFPIKWAVFDVSTTSNGRLKIKIRCISGQYEVWGDIHPPIILNLKKSTRASDYLANLPLQITLSIYIPYMPPRHNLQPLPSRLWGSVTLKDIIYKRFNYVEQMGISKFLLDVFGEMVGVSGGLVPLQSHLTIKMGTASLNLQLTELFSKLFR